MTGVQTCALPICDLNFFDRVLKQYKQWELEQALNHRILTLTNYNDNNEMAQRQNFIVRTHHEMISAVDCSVDGNIRKEVLVGFVELGLVQMSYLTSQSSHEETKSEKIPHIGNLVVSESYRRRGIGMALMQSACALAKSWNYRSVYCAEHANNRAAIELYTQKLGFQVLLSKSNSEGGIDHILEKTL